jgi:Ribosomal protein L10
MDRIAKEKIVSDLTKKFDESNFFILTHNNGLSVHEITNFRNQLREAGSTLKLLKIA